MCTYELVIQEDESTLGSVITSGALVYSEGAGGFLTVEAVSDNYAGFKGGLLFLRYDTIGETHVVVGELSLM
jgi:hypothetical protein